MKALKINVEKKSIEELEITDWRDISPAIGNGCTTFYNLLDFDNGDNLLGDDQFNFKEVHGAFIMEGWEYPIVGNAIILGTKEGDSCDVMFTKAELDKNVYFLNKEDALEYVSTLG
jgi:hypothetical protein